MSQWLRKERFCGQIEQKKASKQNGFLSISDKFFPLMATAELDEASIGVYCREKGIFNFQLKEWKEELMKQDSNKKELSPMKEELKTLRVENKKLKQEIRRKDKALAQATALFILKKKPLLFGGTPRKMNQSNRKNESY